MGLAPLAVVSADDLPFTLNAQSVDYDAAAGTLSATGGVDVTGPEGKLKADTITYSTTNDTLVATGNVVYTDTSGATLVVDKLDLTGKLKTGTAEALRLRLPTMGEIATATSASLKENGTYVMRNLAYSPCKECIGAHKPWTIHANRVVYTPETPEAGASMSYQHAWMDVYGAPVMYLPYFQHPVGPKRATNGILPPQFGHSTVHGDEIRLSGYINSPMENADYTLRTRLMSTNGALLGLERRQITDHTRSTANLTYLNDNATGKVRSHAQLAGDYVVQPGLRLGLNGQIASDDTYLNEFFDRNDPYLASTLYGEWDTQDRYAALSTTHFQDLDPTRSPANTAQVLPHFQFEQMLPLSDGSQLTLGTDIVSLQRGLGSESRRFVTQANIAKPLLFDDGSKLTLGGRLRLDVYDTGGSTNNGLVTRPLPEATFNWEKPFISQSGYHVITPRVMGALSFRGGNANGVPNEDSVAYELDYENLFEPSRFAGLDRVETGPRIVYGLDNHWGSATSTEWQLFVGQGLRKYDDNNLPQSGGAATPVSDWITYASVHPVTWLGLSNHMRLDNATFDIRRMDTRARLGGTGDDEAWFDAGYSFLDNTNENLSLKGNLPVNDQWRFVGASQHDIRNSNTLLAEAGVLYTRDCYEIGFTTRRRGFTSGSLRPSTDYLLNVRLLTLGSEGE